MSSGNPNSGRDNFYRALSVIGAAYTIALLAPFIIPLALFSLLNHAVHKYRLRKAARSFPCAQCGRLLGNESIAMADNAWSQHMRDLQNDRPH